MRGKLFFTFHPHLTSPVEGEGLWIPAFAGMTNICHSCGSRSPEVYFRSNAMIKNPTGIPVTSDRTCAIIAAAGLGMRMQNPSSPPGFTGEVADKIFLPLKNKPLITWTVDAFEKCPSIDEIILVLREENLPQGQVMREKEGWRKVQAIIAGGPRRQDSVFQGLKQAQNCHWVVIHDGARPCVTMEIIEQGLKEAEQWGAAIAAVPVKDTVKSADTQGKVKETLPRETLWAAQTPQVFRYDIIKKAYEKAEDITDDASLVEKLRLPVKIYMGSYENIKVTTQEDLVLAEAILARKK